MTPDQYILLLSLIILIMMVKEYIGQRYTAQEIREAQERAQQLIDQAMRVIKEAQRLYEEARRIVEESGSSGADRAAGTDDRLGP